MPDFSKLHYVNVGPGGTFKPSGNVKTTPADVDAIFGHLQQQQINKLVIHFHGGLVKEGSGMKVARSMHKLYDGTAHPVTFVWETGLLETVKDNLTTIHKTKLFQKLMVWVVKKVSKRWAIGDGRGPGGELSEAEIEAELAKERPFEHGIPGIPDGGKDSAGRIDESELDDIEKEVMAELEIELSADDELPDIIETEVPATPLVSPDFKKDTGADGRGVSILAVVKFVGPIVIRVIKRHLKKRDHGFYPTVVEEIIRQIYIADLGAWVWAGMKDAAEKMWLPNDAPIGEKSHVGRYFLDGLLQAKAANPSLEVHLVGHSAGSIAICQMLRTQAADYGSLIRFKNIAFLAPAVRADLFHAEVVKHPGRYENFRMFTMKDELEQDDDLVKFVYTASLLFLISGVLEKEADAIIAGLERHTRGEKPYDSNDLKEVQAFLRTPANRRLALSKTTGAGPGWNTTSTKHGDFDDDDETRTSLLQMVTGGAT